MSSTIFDTLVVRDRLKTLLKGREKIRGDHKNSNEWLVDWATEWTPDSVQKRVDRWKKAKCVGTEAQMIFVSHVCEYMKILHRGTFGFDGTKKPLPKGFPIYGPVFFPPTIEYFGLVKVAPNGIMQMLKAKDFPEKTVLSLEDVLLEPVHILSPIYFPQFKLVNLQCPVPNCSHKLDRGGFTATGFRAMYGLQSNMKVLGMDFKCEEHGKFSTASSDKHCWSHFDLWLMRDIPHFREKSAFTRQLYDFVSEFRPQTSIGQLAESISQLHMLETRRLQSAWLDYAMANKEKLLEKKIPLEFPQNLQSSSDKDYEINPAPSEPTIRGLYDHFFENQRRKESEQYLRTLAGHTLGMDATVKLANKANVYTCTGAGAADTVAKKQTTVFNPFGGGLLTAVNEDKELVFWELIPTNSPVEMIAPLLEYVERCGFLGVNFREAGEICVDRCCDFRPALKLALPDVPIVQDLMHLKGRILDTVSKKSEHRESVSLDLTRALVAQQADGRKPAIYHSVKDQHQQLLAIFTKYDGIGGVWTSGSKSAFDNQAIHITKGCLQRRYDNLPSHTSGNENWHGRLNSLTRGDASSLPTIVSLVTDAVLRLNLKVKINNLSQPVDSMSRQFRAKTCGSHHIFLVNHILRQTEELTGIDQPIFLNICPEHRFGLVERGFDLHQDKLTRIQTLKSSLKGEQRISSPIDEFIDQVTLNGEADCLTSPILGEKRTYSQFMNENHYQQNSELIDANNYFYETLEIESKRIKVSNDSDGTNTTSLVTYAPNDCLSVSTNTSTCMAMNPNHAVVSSAPTKGLFPIFQMALTSTNKEPLMNSVTGIPPATHSETNKLKPEGRTASMLSTILTTQSADEYISANAIIVGELAICSLSRNIQLELGHVTA